MAADELLVATLRAVTAALREVRAPSMIIGGFAVIAAGFARYTNDVDAIIRGRDADVESVLMVFARHGMVLRDDAAREAIRDKQVLFLRHRDHGVGVDVSFAWFPFEEEALARAVEVDLEGIPTRVAIPEDLILYKTTAWRAQDQYDVAQLLLLHVDDIDVARIRGLLVEIAELLGDPQRLTEFDKLVERARRARR